MAETKKIQKMCQSTFTAAKSVSNHNFVRCQIIFDQLSNVYMSNVVKERKKISCANIYKKTFDRQKDVFPPKIDEEKSIRSISKTGRNGIYV